MVVATGLPKPNLHAFRAAVCLLAAHSLDLLFSTMDPVAVQRSGWAGSARACHSLPRAATPFQPLRVPCTQQLHGLRAAIGCQQPAAAPPPQPRPPRSLAPAASATPSPSSSSSSPKRVVITGGSKGLGFAMAREFLQLGDSVVLCGRNPERLAAAVDALTAEFGLARVHGMPADCSSPEDMQRFGDFVAERLGGCDVWLNNAGAQGWSGRKQRQLAVLCACCYAEPLLYCHAAACST